MKLRKYHIEQILLDYTLMTDKNDTASKQCISYLFFIFFLEIIERNQSNLLNEVVENRKERALLMVSVQWNT